MWENVPSEMTSCQIISKPCLVSVNISSLKSVGVFPTINQCLFIVFYCKNMTPSRSVLKIQFVEFSSAGDDEAYVRAVVSNVGY